MLAQPDSFRQRQIQVCLAWAIHDSRPAIPKCGCDAICTNRRRRSETRRIEIVIQFRLERTTADQVAIGACAGKLCPILADSEDIRRICECNRESGTRLYYGNR